MRERLSLVGVCALLLTASAMAQTAVTTSGGTTNSVPVFTGAASVGNSVITQSNGNVGIGTTNPGFKLEVEGGSVNIDTGVLHVPGGGDGTNPSLHFTSYAPPAFNPGGSIGIWLANNGLISTNAGMSIGAKLDVAGVINGRNFSIPGVGSGSWAKIGTFTASQGGESIQIRAFIHNGFNAMNSQDTTYVISFKTSNGGSVDPNGFAGNGSFYAIGFNNQISPGNIKWVANAAGTSATSYDLYINLPGWTGGSWYSVNIDNGASWTNVGTLASSDPGPASSSILIPPAEFDLPYGNMGIGTGSPGAKLEVNGNVKLTSGSGASITFADGTVQSTAWTGSLCGGDYAEAVSGSGDRAQYEPGDVLVLSDDDRSDVSKSAQAYSTSVAGIYSTKPGLIGRRHAAKSDTEIPMAMVGIVPTKVSVENGSIRRGDLLVTSSTPGYAMKGTDRSRMLGAIVGKAMGNLESGTGVIEVLVSLQ